MNSIGGCLKIVSLENLKFQENDADSLMFVFFYFGQCSSAFFLLDVFCDWIVMSA